ncbi:MAG TPA: molybdopterin-dependent oxidoreductase, partial [Candidatus Eisenbacteria bacterium]|nr:molybdopterin-dependent oxidoreductase [Candidatus Eisenbacteria bacterium]
MAEPARSHDEMSVSPPAIDLQPADATRASGSRRPESTRPPASVITIRGACPHDCPDTCATLVDVRDGRAVGFRGDPDHPITQGWLCAKVRPYLQRVYAPDRLLHPLRRVGAKGGGEWARISWDEAIAEITERWRAIIADHGGAAILPYSFSGTLGLL